MAGYQWGRTGSKGNFAEQQASAQLETGLPVKRPRRSFLPAPRTISLPSSSSSTTTTTTLIASSDVASLLIGDRVNVQGYNSGILKFKGKTKFAKGEWCGIALDEPVGKHNGKVGGVQYFTCEPKHGILVLSYKVSHLKKDSSSGAGAALSSSLDILPSLTQQNNKKPHSKIPPPKETSKLITSTGIPKFGRLSQSYGAACNVTAVKEKGKSDTSSSRFGKTAESKTHSTSAWSDKATTISENTVKKNQKSLPAIQERKSITPQSKPDLDRTYSLENDDTKIKNLPVIQEDLNSTYELPPDEKDTNVTQILEDSFNQGATNSDNTVLNTTVDIKDSTFSCNNTTFSKTCNSTSFDTDCNSLTQEEQFDKTLDLTDISHTDSGGNKPQVFAETPLTFMGEKIQLKDAEAVDALYPISIPPLDLYTVPPEITSTPDLEFVQCRRGRVTNQRHKLLKNCYVTDCLDGAPPRKRVAVIEEVGMDSTQRETQSGIPIAGTSVDESNTSIMDVHEVENGIEKLELASGLSEFSEQLSFDIIKSHMSGSESDSKGHIEQNNDNSANGNASEIQTIDLIGDKDVDVTCEIEETDSHDFTTVDDMSTDHVNLDVLATCESDSKGHIERNTDNSVNDNASEIETIDLTDDKLADIAVMQTKFDHVNLDVLASCEIEDDKQPVLKEKSGQTSSHDLATLSDMTLTDQQVNAVSSAIQPTVVDILSNSSPVAHDQTMDMTGIDDISMPCIELDVSGIVPTNSTTSMSSDISSTMANDNIKVEKEKASIKSKSAGSGDKDTPMKRKVRDAKSPRNLTKVNENDKNVPLQPRSASRTLKNIDKRPMLRKGSLDSGRNSPVTKETADNKPKSKYTPSSWRTSKLSSPTKPPSPTEPKDRGGVVSPRRRTELPILPQKLNFATVKSRIDTGRRSSLKKAEKDGDELNESRLGEDSERRSSISSIKSLKSEDATITSNILTKSTSGQKPSSQKSSQPSSKPVFGSRMGERRGSSSSITSDISIKSDISKGSLSRRSSLPKLTTGGAGNIIPPSPRLQMRRSSEFGTSSSGSRPRPTSSSARLPLPSPSPRRTPLTDHSREKSRPLKVKPPSSTATPASSSQPDLLTATIAAENVSKEVERLEALCEARTKELTIMKLQLKNGLTGFDAMSTVVKYFAQRLEVLSNFHEKQLLEFEEEKTSIVQQLDKRIDQLISNADQQKCEHEEQLRRLTETLNDEHNTEVESLNQELTKRNVILEKLEEQVEQLKCETEQQKSEMEDKLRTLEEKLNAEHATEIESIKEELEKRYEEEKQTLNEMQEVALQKAMSDYSQNLQNIKAQHREELSEMRKFNTETLKEKDEKYTKDNSILITQHQDEIEEITKEYTTKIKNITTDCEKQLFPLKDEVETLTFQLENYKEKVKMLEEALQKDSDKKVQVAIAQFKDLPAEVESLKCVIELKNKEIHDQRKTTNTMKKRLERIPEMEEEIKRLKAQTESLMATVDTKSAYERQLSSEHVVLREHIEKESQMNKRLSMENEELYWKLQNSDTSSPILGMTPSSTRSTLSPSPTHHRDYSRRPMSRSSSTESHESGVFPLSTSQ
uniref:Probable GPI-anchored adhesin-like protein PGA55-like n=1 Tax=Saccoglossus kowalevskii TaxID=10224 RepID=A0ABM0M3J7_SACKO|nr:PREDICTED: probable GPI-anchored adhesin-like protein PGA55-like [Saccoglossus kowalevskii]